MTGNAPLVSQTAPQVRTMDNLGLSSLCTAPDDLWLVIGDTALTLLRRHQLSLPTVHCSSRLNPRLILVAEKWRGLGQSRSVPVAGLQN
jgi:hypothetical protein